MNDLGRTVVIGAGPAGLTASYLLAKEGRDVVVFEADPQYVGGISRTVNYKGFLLDIGGHRFFSKSRIVRDLWNELLPDDLLLRQRTSHIYYQGKFFAYPLKAFEALTQLGLFEALACSLSYLKAQLLPVKAPKTFEDWVGNRFGRRLFRTFFRTYTEKVWGMTCREISADWAAQRIMNLSLLKAVWNGLFNRRASPFGQSERTLTKEFHYPKRGPGMMWEACARKLQEHGGHVRLGTKVERCAFDSASGLWTVHTRDAQGNPSATQARHVISSAPLSALAEVLTPPLSETSLKAARSLKYRDFLIVSLIVRERKPLKDNWIYVHDPDVKVGRIQNFKAWSPHMVPDPSLACFGLEYFCFKGDELWESSDEALLELAKREIVHINLCRREDILDGCVLRQPKAYPVYDAHYEAQVRTLRTELANRYPGFHTVGRNGMHKYNNQDHSMLTAWLTADKILHPSGPHRDPWRINEAEEYLEGFSETGADELGQRQVPLPVTSPVGA